MKSKRLFKAIAFACIFVLVFNVVDKVMKAKLISDTSATYVISGMYDTKENSIDVCIVGTSQQVYGLSAMRMLDKYGISAYSCATGDQPVLASMFLVKELDKRHDIKMVIFDPGMMFSEIEEAKYRTVLDQAKLSKNKMDAVNIMRKYKEINRWTYVLPIMKYHTRWGDIKEKDFRYKEMNDKVFRGSIMHGAVTRIHTDEDFQIDNDDPDEKVNINKEALECLDEMVKYCKENDITLIFTKSPKPSWTKAMSLECQRYAYENGITFLDFNYKKLYDAVGFDAAHDFMNADHLNVRGCDKYTDYISNYILKNYAFDKREIDDKEMMDTYLSQHVQKYFQSSIDIYQFTEMYQDGDYEMLVSSSGDISSFLDENSINELNSIGLNINTDNLKGMNYVAHLDGNELVYEESSDSAIKYSDKLSNGKSFSIYSDISEAVDSYPAQVAGETIKYKKKGMNVIIYDKQNKSVIDYFTIWYDSELKRIDIYHDPDLLSLK